MHGNGSELTTLVSVEAHAVLCTLETTICHVSLPRLGCHCLPHVHRVRSGGMISRESSALRAAPAPSGSQSLTAWVLSQLTVARPMGRFIGPLGNFSHNSRSFFVLDKKKFDPMDKGMKLHTCGGACDPVRVPESASR